MEKLIVKNFGPIKEAEIDLTKYIVFIGDTSTGKSVLAKLIAIFRNFDLYRNSNYYISFVKLLKNFNIDFLREDSIIHFLEDEFDLKISNFKAEISNEIIIDFDEKKIEEQERKTDELFESFYKMENDKSLDEASLEKINEFRLRLIELQSDLEKVKEGVKMFKDDSIIYIPAERIIYSMVSNSMSGLLANNVALPDCYKIFAGKFEVARKNIKSKRYFDFTYSFADSQDKIIISGNNINLSQASSGIQSLIPLLLVFDDELNKSESNKSIKTFVIEEPELNLFPKRQKMIIDYVVEEINKTESSVVFTTHSPYILSSLDTLILANNTYNEHSDLKEEINAIVSEDKWIDYDDIAVYEVRNDGKVYSIKNEEFRSIDTNAIDGVSDIISEEFDKLTELRYAQ